MTPLEAHEGLLRIADIDFDVHIHDLTEAVGRTVSPSIMV